LLFTGYANGRAWYFHSLSEMVHGCVAQVGNFLHINSYQNLKIKFKN
jgi:hypothetical protein